MVDLAQDAVLDHLFCQLDGGNPTVVEASGVAHSGGVHGIAHLLHFIHRTRQWLLAEDHFPGLRGGNCDLDMRVTGRDNINDINIIPLYQLAVICLVALEAKLLRRRFYFLFTAPTKRLQNGLHAQLREEAVELTVGIAVCFAHELISHQTDTNLFCHVFVSSKKRDNSPR